MSKVSNVLKAPIRIAGKVIQPVKNLLPKRKRNPKSNGLLDYLRDPDIRRKILITIFLILVFRLLSAIPLPGIDIKVFNQIFGGSALNNVFTIVTAGRLDDPSVLAIGLGAYINASIIIQLLTTIIPKLEELSKEGERGKKIINQYTRFLTLPLSIAQSLVIYILLKNLSAQSPDIAALTAKIQPIDIITMVSALTAGSMILMWISELITEYGIGNGSSVIIAVGIITVLPRLIAKDFQPLVNDINLLKNGNFNVLTNENFMLLYALIIGLIIIVATIVYITEATRKVTIQYASRFRSAQGIKDSYLPIKINQAGVVPVIFASAFLSFPQIISQLLVNTAAEGSFLKNLGTSIANSFLGRNFTNFSSADYFYYYAVYLFLIIVFSYFYTFIAFKPNETADNLQKSGGFIPGIRPGKATEDFITHILIRLTFIGSLFLAVMALIPSLVRLTHAGQQLTIFAGIGGTSILIIVGVILDTQRQIKSLSVSKSYDQFKV